MDTITYCRYAQLRGLHGRFVSNVFAASAGNEEIVVDLLGAGADIKKTNDKGLTAL